MAQNGNMRNFGPTNQHCTAFTPKQWYYQKEATGIESSKMQIPYLPVRGGKVSRFMGGSIGPRMEICRTSGLPILMVPRLHQSNGNVKRKLRAWRVQTCIAQVGAHTVLSSAGPQITPFHGG